MYHIILFGTVTKGHPVEMEQYSAYVAGVTNGRSFVLQRCCESHVCINVQCVSSLQRWRLARIKQRAADGDEGCGFRDGANSAVYSRIFGKEHCCFGETRFRYQDQIAQIIEVFDKSDNQKRARLGATKTLEWLHFYFLMTSKVKSKWILKDASLNKVQQS